MTVRPVEAMRVVTADREAPLFLVGAPRSGTSLLYKLLCLHPGAAYISNWMRRAPGVPALTALNRVAARFPDTRRSVWFGADTANAYVYGQHRSSLERLFPMPIEGEPVYRRCGMGQAAWSAGTPAVEIDRLRRTFAAVRRYGGGRLVVSKRIANNHFIPALAKAFPAARFVSIVRDGRAVAYSLGRVDWWEDSVVWWYGGTPRGWREEGRDPWELCARHWLRELALVDEGLRAVPAAQRLDARYEELVAQPVGITHRVATFAGLPDDRDWTEGLGQLRYPDNNKRWREQLTRSERELVEAIQESALRRLGYIG